jgi:hypothetical protein
VTDNFGYRDKPASTLSMRFMTDTTPDFRALCAELVAGVDALLSQGESPANPGQRLILTAHVEDLGDMADRARAALTQPVAELRAIAAAIRDHDDLCDSSAVDVALWLDDQANLAEAGGC